MWKVVCFALFVQVTFAIPTLTSTIENKTSPCADQLRILFWLDYTVNDAGFSIVAVNVGYFRSNVAIVVPPNATTYTPPTTSNPDSTFWDPGNANICYSYVGLGQIKGIADCTTTDPSFLINGTTFVGGWSCDNPDSPQIQLKIPNGSSGSFFVAQLLIAQQSEPDVTLGLQIFMLSADKVVTSFSVNVSPFAVVSTTSNGGGASTDTPPLTPVNFGRIMGIIFGSLFGAVVFVVALVATVWSCCVYHTRKKVQQSIHNKNAKFQGSYDGSK